MAKDQKNLPDHPDRYKHQADKVRNMRAEEGVVQQKVQLTPPGEPTHVPQRKHDVSGYRTVGAVGGDVPAYNPDAPPVTVPEEELDVSPLGLPVEDGKSTK